MKFLAAFFLLHSTIAQNLLKDFTSTITEAFEEKSKEISEFSEAMTKIWSKSHRSSPLIERKNSDLPTIEFTHDGPSSREGRVLQSGFPNFCVKPGISIKADKNLFFCNGKNINKTEYDKLRINTTNKCSSNKTFTDACYCPRDYIGTGCQTNNRVKCVINDKFKENCPKFDSYFYNDRWDGDPPCKMATRSDIVDFQINLKCQNNDLSQLQEGFKGIGNEDWSGYTKPDISYVVNETNLSRIICLFQ